jgi:hypothetical protein
MHRLYCRDLQLNLDVHLACHQVAHLELRLVRQLQQNHHRLRLDVVRQNRRDDLRLDVVRQNRRDDLRLDDLGRLDVVRQNRRDDLRLDDLVHLVERLLAEVLQLRRHLDEVLRCRM